VTMQNFKVGPFTRSILIAMVFFVLGRIIMLQMGSNGIWLIAVLLVVFYFGWWVLFRRGKNN
jgi:hypothetical protein